MLRGRWKRGLTISMRPVPGRDEPASGSLLPRLGNEHREQLRRDR